MENKEYYAMRGAEEKEDMIHDYANEIMTLFVYLNEALNGGTEKLLNYSARLAEIGINITGKFITDMGL